MSENSKRDALAIKYSPSEKQRFSIPELVDLLKQRVGAAEELWDACRAECESELKAKDAQIKELEEKFETALERIKLRNWSSK